MRWSRAFREKHLEVCRTFFWPWVRTDDGVLLGRPLMVLYNTFYINGFFFLHFKVKCARSVPAYFAETLYKAMKVFDLYSNYYFGCSNVGFYYGFK